MRISSRTVALLLSGFALYRWRPHDSSMAYFLFALLVALVLIWFPEKIDEYTFGTWTKGNRIDVHTPPLMIAIFGWMLLLVEVVVVTHPEWITHFFYGS